MATERARTEFDDYVRARYDRLVRSAYLLCGDWQHAEDLVQTALAKAYVAHRRGHVESLDAYVHRTLVNARASVVAAAVARRGADRGAARARDDR